VTDGNKHCEQLIPFLLKELPPEEAQAFQLHLTTCHSCREEWTELQQVWQTLPYKMDEVEVPELLKADMLNRILEEIDEQPQPLEPLSKTEADHSGEKAAVRSIKRRKLGSYAAASIVCFVVGAAAGWGLNEYSRNPASPGVQAVAPAQMVEQYALKAFDPAMPAASGQCWIKQQGQQEQLIVQVNGLGRNAGDQAYQVWIVKQGIRFNGGTFRVDDNGNGVLTYDLQPFEREFETIGITLEPDALGSKPRGKKVLGL